MNKPVDANQVTVNLSADDADDLSARVERGEFSSLDEAVAAELAELNYRRASAVVGGSDKLEALLDQLEADDDPAGDVDAGPFFEALKAGLRQRLENSRG